MKENEKPVWITRDGVDVAVVISPELFEELVSAQEELEDIKAVDEAQIKERLARQHEAISVEIDEL